MMLSAVLEEEPDLYEAFPPHVDPTGITILTDSPPGNYKIFIMSTINIFVHALKIDSFYILIHSLLTLMLMWHIRVSKYIET